MSKFTVAARRRCLAGVALIAAASIALVARSGYACETRQPGTAASGGVSGLSGLSATATAASASAGVAADPARFDPAHRHIAEPPAPADAPLAPTTSDTSINES